MQLNVLIYILSASTQTSMLSKQSNYPKHDHLIFSAQFTSRANLGSMLNIIYQTNPHLQFMFLMVNTRKSVLAFLPKTRWFRCAHRHLEPCQFAHLLEPTSAMMNSGRKCLLANACNHHASNKVLHSPATSSAQCCLQ